MPRHIDHKEMPKQPITPELVDLYLAFGIAVQKAVQASLNHPDLEVHMRDGLLMLGYVGEAPTYYVGTSGVELTSVDWETLVAAMAKFPIRKREGGKNVTCG